MNKIHTKLIIPSVRTAIKEEDWLDAPLTKEEIRLFEGFKDEIDWDEIEYRKDAPEMDE